MKNKPLLHVLPILLLLLAGSAAAAPWTDAVPAGHWMSPFDAFEENISLSLARERVGASVNDTELQGALRDWKELLDILSSERAAEQRDVEARYASGALTPARFNTAMDQVRERGRSLEQAREQQTLQEAAARETSLLPPPPVSNISNTTYEPYRVNWTWREPSGPFLHVEASLDGASPLRIPRGTGRVTLANATPDRDYTLSLRVVARPPTHPVSTVETRESGAESRGLASPWTNHTARTAPDPPPGNVTNLSVVDRGRTHLAWNWTLPADGDLSHTQFLANGTERALLTRPGFNLTNLSPGSTVQVSVRAVDRAGQPGPWTNATRMTLPASTPTPGGGLFTPVPTPATAASCPRCEDVEDCDSCNNGICSKWKVTQGEGKQEFTCQPPPSPSPSSSPKED